MKLTEHTVHIEDRKIAHNILTGILNVKMSYRRTVHRWQDNSHMYGFDSTVICLNISNNMHHTLTNSEVLTQSVHL